MRRICRKTNKNTASKLAVRTMAATLALMSAGSAIPGYAAWQQGAGANSGRWWYATNNENTAWHSNSWQWIDGNGDGVAECYYFGPDGYMYAGTTTPDGYTVDTNGAWTVNGAVQTRNIGTGTGNTSSTAGGTGAGTGTGSSTVENYGNGGSWKQGAGANSGKWWFDNGDGTFSKGGWHWLDGNKDGVAECYYFDNDGWLITDGRTPDGYTVNGGGAWTDNGSVRTKTTGHAGSGTAGRSIAGSVITGGGSIAGSTISGGGSGSSGGGSISSGGSSGGSSSGSSSSSSSSSGDFYSSSSSANNFKTGNYGMMTSDEKSEVKEAIEEFKDEHISSDMSDYEKEMTIIRWLCEHVTYESSDEDWTYSTAYAAIINGEAQCAGYADAFLQMAKACGLEARYVVSRTHAWNQVKIEGKWYHVDVTWADTGSGDYVNTERVNLTDKEVSKLSVDHRSWSPTTIKCTGGKYGQEYMKTLRQKELDERLKKRSDETIRMYENNRGCTVIEYTTFDETADSLYELIKAEMIKYSKRNHHIYLEYLIHMPVISEDEADKIIAAVEEDVIAKLKAYSAENIPTKRIEVEFGSASSLPDSTCFAIEEWNIWFDSEAAASSTASSDADTESDESETISYEAGEEESVIVIE